MNGLVYLDTSIILSILLETEKYQTAEDMVASFQDKTFVTSGVALKTCVGDNYTSLPKCPDNESCIYTGTDENS